MTVNLRLQGCLAMLAPTIFCANLELLLIDHLHIKALSISARIGVYAWEQQILQRLLIDIIIPADFSACDDQLINTIDYEKLCHEVTQHVESKSFQLIETVANDVANLIKTRFDLKALTVSVSKPHAIKNAADVKVTVTR